MRLRMSLNFDDPTPLPPPDPLARPVSSADAPALAELMLSAYRGTVDDAGAGADEAAAEVARLLSGGYGAFDFAASEVVTRDGRVVAATLVTEFQGIALVAFSMTEPAWQRRGLARAGLLRAIARLVSNGRQRVDLAVTSANTPAVTLYRALGFREITV